jgi:ribose transport system ATP-binding protein
MDEPSAVLAHDEVANLFRVIRGLTAQGIAVIYISHRLDEIRDIGDRVTVLKDGRTTAANLDAKTTPTQELVSRMTGRNIEYVFPPRSEAPASPEGAPLLAVDGLTRDGEFADVSLNVHSGEIVGITGLVGSGRSELLETIFGARRPHAGQITVDGRSLRAGSVPAAVKAGTRHGARGAQKPGAVLGEPVYRNVTLANFGHYARAGFTDAAKERRAPTTWPSGWTCARATCAGWCARCPAATSRRWWWAAGCSAAPRLLLLDEPTRGVDVGARAELYQVIRRLADAGVGVLMISSEVPRCSASPTAWSSCARAASCARRPPPTSTKKPFSTS